MARIVIEVPDGNKELVAATTALAEAISQVVDRGAGGKSLDYARVEREVGEGVAAVERAVHQAILRSLDVDAPCVRIEGATWTRVGRYPATYYTLAGPVEVERSVYRRDGARNSMVVDPISLRAGVIADGWLPQTARAMAHHIQGGTAREAERRMAELGRLPYSPASFSCVAHAVGELYADRTSTSRTR